MSTTEEKEDRESLDSSEEIETSGTPPEEETPQRKLEAALREVETTRDKLLRTAAEFANYRRRMETEFRNVIENASERVIADLLPVLDDLDRFLQSSTKHENSYDALVQGVELISSKITGILAKRGLKTFDSTGQTFDVNMHDALLMVPREDVPPNTVVEEVAKGYYLNDKVLRHAKVVVSAPAESSENPSPRGEGEPSQDGD